MAAHTSLLERRQSYERIPQFFFPKLTIEATIPSDGLEICRQRAQERIDLLLLTDAEMQHFIGVVCGYAFAPRLSSFQRTLMKKTAKASTIVAIDRLVKDQMTVNISYTDWKEIIRSTRTSKLESMMPARAFLSLPQDDDGKINGLTLLKYVHELHRVLVANRFILEQPECSFDAVLSESDLAAIVRRAIQAAIQAVRLQDVDGEFLQYYEVICVRTIVLRHDLVQTRGGIPIDDVINSPVFLEWLQLIDPRLHSLFSVDTNRFHSDAVRLIHRQYLQLDTNKNGMLSIEEMLQYGKKKAFNPIEQTPTHDLTTVFVERVFNEVKTFPPDNEMDYKTYVDLTLTMADQSSVASLRFFWRVLDLKKQGYLDAFTIDVFLRDLVVKIHQHDREEVMNEQPSATVVRLRTQVFDLVAPKDPLRITWHDLEACRLGHLVVRMLTDFVAYRFYQSCEGRFPPTDSRV